MSYATMVPMRFLFLWIKIAFFYTIIFKAFEYNQAVGVGVTFSVAFLFFKRPFFWILAYIRYFLDFVFGFKKRRWRNKSLATIKDWKEFEEFSAECLRQKGFKAYTQESKSWDSIIPKEISKSAGAVDGGVDIIAFWEGERKGFFKRSDVRVIHLVQCKFYKEGNNISAGEISKLVGVARFFATKYPNHQIIPVFLTTSAYTRAAINQSAGVWLYDGPRLGNYLYKDS